MTSCRRRSIAAWLAALPFVAILSGWPQVSEAAEYLTAVAGGGGGTAFTLRCQNDQVLAGITGQASALIDRIQLLCVQVDPLGRWVGTPYAASVAGGTGGKQFSRVCAPNHAVSGIIGRASVVIDQLQIRCGPLTNGPRLNAIGTFFSLAAGGTGGSEFGPFDCADSKPGSGLTGRAGTYVDQLRLACNFPGKPLKPDAAYFRPNDTIGAQFFYIARRIRSTTVFLQMSGTPRGTYWIPATSSNPAVATFSNQSGGQVSHISNPGFADLRTGHAGCTTLTIGYPGALLRPLTLLVDKPGYVGSTSTVSLTLTPNILEWTSTTTSAFATLTIPTAAPTGGTRVALTTSHPTVAAIPTSVTIPVGARSTTFEIRKVSSFGGCVIFTATGNGVTAQSPILFPTQLLKRL
jgi:hypothetical protein